MVLWRVWREYRWFYTWPAIWWHRLSLFARIVWRIDQSGFRMDRALAWEVVCMVHGKHDHWRAA